MDTLNKNDKEILSKKALTIVKIIKVIAIISLAIIVIIEGLLFAIMHDVEKNDFPETDKEVVRIANSPDLTSSPYFPFFMVYAGSLVALIFLLPILIIKMLTIIYTIYLKNKLQNNQIPALFFAYLFTLIQVLLFLFVIKSFGEAYFILILILLNACLWIALIYTVRKLRAIHITL